jgi:hypothetical protein
MCFLSNASDSPITLDGQLAIVQSRKFVTSEYACFFVITIITARYCSEQQWTK